MKIDVCKIISSDQNSHNENNKILQQILIVLFMNLWRLIIIIRLKVITPIINLTLIIQIKKKEEK